MRRNFLTIDLIMLEDLFFNSKLGFHVRHFQSVFPKFGQIFEFYIEQKKNLNILVKIKIYSSEIDFLIDYIENYFLVSFLTQRHNCGVRKDSDRSNHTIVTLFQEWCDLIGHYIFWHHSYDAEWESLPRDNLQYVYRSRRLSQVFISYFDL